jgi:hypothetical protein
MKFVEKNGELKLMVGYHEWAWSFRTSGMPVWALFPDGHAEEIGGTDKKPTSYTIPAGAVGVVRKYESYSGLLTFHVYSLPDGVEYYVEEQFNFSTANLPEKLREPVTKFLVSEGLPIFEEGEKNERRKGRKRRG